MHNTGYWDSAAQWPWRRAKRLLSFVSLHRGSSASTATYMQPISCSRRAAAAGDGRLHLLLINPQGGYCSANSINRTTQYGKPGERLPRIARADANSVQIGPDLITNLLGSRHVCSSSSFVSSRFTGGCQAWARCANKRCESHQPCAAFFNSQRSFPPELSSWLQPGGVYYASGANPDGQKGVARVPTYRNATFGYPLTPAQPMPASQFSTISHVHLHCCAVRSLSTSGTMSQSS